MRTWRMRRLLSRFQPYTLEKTYGSLRLRVHIADPLAQGWYGHDWDPLPEIDLLQSSGLSPGARVFDLGAHQGVVAMILANQVGPSGQVIAVEALPHNARVCRMNAALNRFLQIQTVAAAVADHVGEIDVCIDLNAQVRNAATNIATVRVPAVTVDDLAEQHGPPAVVFLDVEGYECHALRGAGRTLERALAWYVEVHGGCGLELAGGSVAELFAYFPPSAYEVLVWTEHNPAPALTAGAPDCPPGRFFLLARRKRCERRTTATA
jgi:FkbM family methyltransferase